MKYIRKFNDHNAYSAFIVGSNFAAIQTEQNTSVSYCKNERHIHYNPYIDPYNGYEYVDLGLPSGTIWAKINVGATTETDYGNYYMYGKGIFQYNNGDSIYEGTENPLSINVDTAAQVMGGQWHMPTQIQIQELIDNTIKEWININNINGYKFISTNGNYIFFPAAGYCEYGNLYEANSQGYYWSITPSNSNAYRMSFHDHGIFIHESNRNYGFSVRGVIG